MENPPLYWAEDRAVWAPLSDALAQVRGRFSHADSAQKWHRMYQGGTERLDEENFRRRREVTVAHVVRIATPASRVLDLGCGAGPVLADLRQRGITVLGLDASPDMLYNARQRLESRDLPQDGLFLGDCCRTEWANESFDVIVCLGVISYIEDYAPALDEIGRLLKPGGTVLLSYRNVFNPLFSDPLRLLRHALRKLATPVLGPRRPASFKIGRFLDFREVDALMRQRGFAPAGFHGIGFGPYRLGDRRLLGERGAIRLSRALHALARGVRMQQVLRWPTDVSLWIYRKPGRDA